jgi:hypothetical protein
MDLALAFPLGSGGVVSVALDGGGGFGGALGGAPPTVYCVQTDGVVAYELPPILRRALLPDEYLAGRPSAPAGMAHSTASAPSQTMAPAPVPARPAPLVLTPSPAALRQQLQQTHRSPGMLHAASSPNLLPPTVTTRSPAALAAAAAAAAGASAPVVTAAAATEPAPVPSPLPMLIPGIPAAAFALPGALSPSPSPVPAAATPAGRPAQPCERNRGSVVLIALAQGQGGRQ